MSYKHLSPEERYYLEIEKKSGKSSNAIASALGRSQTTISRELKRNTGNEKPRFFSFIGFDQTIVVSKGHRNCVL